MIVETTNVILTEEWLNRFGADGWELVQILDTDTRRTAAIFKRGR